MVSIDESNYPGAQIQSRPDGGGAGAGADVSSDNLINRSRIQTTGVNQTTMIDEGGLAQSIMQSD